jgi:hypothetical protein
LDANSDSGNSVDVYALIEKLEDHDADVNEDMESGINDRFQITRHNITGDNMKFSLMDSSCRVLEKT